MSNGSLKKLLALVVEDDFDSMEMLVSILEGTGAIDCQSSKGGQQALEFFVNKRPHITFLDIDIPGPDGIEILAKMRKLIPDAKIVMVTANSEINTVKKAISLGAIGYIVKPFVPEKIIAVLKKMNS